MPWIAPAAVVLAVTSFLGGAVALSSGTGSSTSCGNGTVDVTAVANDKDTIAGYSGDQLVNAADIMNAAIPLQLDSQAQVIGVMTAMGESGLQILDHGDAAGPDSRGLFQQRDSWGSLADRMDATASATLFYTWLAATSGWETMTPSEAASTVQVNADPDFYTSFYPNAVAVVQALTSVAGGNGCAISGDAQALAQQLVDAANHGLVRGLVPDHIKEIRWIAQGKVVPDCGIDIRILQVMVVALEKFHSIGVGDINRKCTGQQTGAGTESSHWINGGGDAVDLFSLGGQSLTGADGQSLRLISMLDPIVPKGARIGQAECRAATGLAVDTIHFTQYDDTCNHLHIDVAFTPNPLTLNAPAE